MTKVSVIKWSQVCTRSRTIRSGGVGIPNYLKMHAKPVVLTILAIPKTPLLMVLIQFWDPSITDTFVTLLLKSHLGPWEMVFQGYSVLWLISYFNPHCTFNCKFRPWRSWAITLKIFVVDQCTQRHNKKHQPTCLDVFNKNWHTLPTCFIVMSWIMEGWEITK